jgi:hypothetical protein
MKQQEDHGAYMVVGSLGGGGGAGGDTWTKNYGGRVGSKYTLIAVLFTKFLEMQGAEKNLKFKGGMPPRLPLMDMYEIELLYNFYHQWPPILKKLSLSIIFQYILAYNIIGRTQGDETALCPANILFSLCSNNVGKGRLLLVMLLLTQE